MGKTNDESSNDGSITDVNVGSSSLKRHKRHKHKKHKKKKHPQDSESYIDVGGQSDLKRTFKIKIRKDNERSPDKSREHIFKVTQNPSSNLSMSLSPRTAAKKKVMKISKGKESGTSSEEERWLDAIESGKLEEVDDELKKIKPKDPKLMTARQRAMFERKTDTEPNSNMEQLMSLPLGYKEKVLTAEAIQKAALKSQKRKQLADEKREKDKKKTMERLLKKQESKTSKVVPKTKTTTKYQVPLITYKSTPEESTISVPIGEGFPLLPTKIREPLEPIHCGVFPCSNRKKYCCSKTGIPLCSLACYRANLLGFMS